MGTGFFGKLPTNGDFVARGLPAGVQPVLDRWLTRLLVACGDAAERWPEDGLRGLIAHAGHPLALLVVPSQDAAGREFPLAALTPANDAGRAEIDIWAGLALPALRDAAQGGLDAAGLVASLGSIPAISGPGDGAGLVPPLVWTGVSPPEDPADFMARMTGIGCSAPNR